MRHRYRDGAFELSLARLAIDRARATACVGPSGSGKTTLLHLAAGILLPAEGRVRFEGVAWSDLPERERRLARIARIGMVFQDFALFDHLTVRENVLLPYLVHGALALDAAVEERVRTLAEAAGIRALLDRRPRALSHGERQRVALCRALVTEPAVLLADEPTGNLDARTGARAVDLLLELTVRRGGTLVVVTHDRGLLPRFDRVIDLEHGVEEVPT